MTLFSNKISTTKTYEKNSSRGIESLGFPSLVTTITTITQNRKYIYLKINGEEEEGGRPRELMGTMPQSRT